MGLEPLGIAENKMTCSYLMPPPAPGSLAGTCRLSSLTLPPPPPRLGMEERPFSSRLKKIGELLGQDSVTREEVVSELGGCTLPKAYPLTLFSFRVASGLGGAEGVSAWHPCHHTSVWLPGSMASLAGSSSSWPAVFMPGLAVGTLTIPHSLTLSSQQPLWGLSTLRN